MPQPLFAVAELAAAAPPWRVAVGRAGSILRALLGSREVRVVRRVARVALWPVNFVLGNILSGNWVPSGPWIVVWSSFAFAANVQTYKQIVGLSWRLAKAQVAAWRGDSEEKSRVACELCDTIIGLILKFDSNSPEDIDCGELCPFGMGKCVRTCESIVEAIATSSHYPCVAAQLCADFGDRFSVLSELAAAPLTVAAVVGTLPGAAGVAPTSELLQRRPVVFESAYASSSSGSRFTPLLEQAMQFSCPTIEGLELLFEQGVRQNAIWTGLRQPEAPPIGDSALQWKQHRT